MFVRELGRGPPVLLLHGTPSPATDWWPLAKRLATRHRVLVPDLPGYGASPALDARTTDATTAALEAMLVEHHATHLAAIAGYSTGAYRAFELALRGTIAIDRVVSVAGVACFDAESRTLRRSIAERLRAEPAYFGSAELRDVLPEMMLSPAWLARFPQHATAVKKWLDLTTAAALADELVALADARDLRPALARLPTPVYLRVGTLDRGCPPAWSEELARVLPHARLELVDGCGHGLFIEDAEMTVAAIDRWLAESDARA